MRLLVASIESFLALVLILTGLSLGLFALVARELFSYSWLPSLGLLSLITVWGALLGMVRGLDGGAHVSLDILVDRLPPALKRWADAFDWLVVFAFMGYLGYLSWEYTRFLYAHGGSSVFTSLPQWLEVAPVTAILFLAAAHSLDSLIRSIRRNVAVRT